MPSFPEIVFRLVLFLERVAPTRQSSLVTVLVLSVLRKPQLQENLQFIRLAFPRLRLVVNQARSPVLDLLLVQLLALLVAQLLVPQRQVQPVAPWNVLRPVHLVLQVIAPLLIRRKVLLLLPVFVHRQSLLPVPVRVPRKIRLPALLPVLLSVPVNIPVFIRR
jgi:hypothetical protein